MPESLRDQYQYFTEAKMDKISQIFPDFKFHSLEEGVKDYITNHLSQKDTALKFKEIKC